MEKEINKEDQTDMDKRVNLKQEIKQKYAFLHNSFLNCDDSYLTSNRFKVVCRQYRKDIQEQSNKSGPEREDGIRQVFQDFITHVLMKHDITHTNTKVQVIIQSEIIIG